MALKGPARDGSGLPSNVWGFRRWNRLVALDIQTGNYRVFSLPKPQSEALAYPLWSNPPAFGVANHTVYVGIGAWIGEFPSQPMTAGTSVRHGAPSSVRVSARIHRALSLLYQESWQSVNADVAFWNCSVMKDPSRAACPTGQAVVSHGAVSQNPAYFNHGDVGFPLLWASLLPMSNADAAERAVDVARLRAALRGSLMMVSIAQPSAKALRSLYPGGPPFPLPGYTRRGGLYWAKG